MNYRTKFAKNIAKNEESLREEAFSMLSNTEAKFYTLGTELIKEFEYLEIEEFCVRDLELGVRAMLKSGVAGMKHLRHCLAHNRLEIFWQEMDTWAKQIDKQCGLLLKGIENVNRNEDSNGKNLD